MQVDKRTISSIRQTKIREVHSVLCLAPMDNLMRTVNEHLKDCTFCKGSRLQLKIDWRIRFALNYKLAYKSCNIKDMVLLQNIYYLKLKFKDSQYLKERRKVSKEISQKRRMLRRRKGNAARGTLPHLLFIKQQQSKGRS